jgi:hypothetical protein
MTTGAGRFAGARDFGQMHTRRVVGKPNQQQLLMVPIPLAERWRFSRSLSLQSVPNRRSGAPDNGRSVRVLWRWTVELLEGHVSTVHAMEDEVLPTEAIESGPSDHHVDPA